MVASRARRSSGLFAIPGPLAILLEPEFRLAV